MGANILCQHVQVTAAPERGTAVCIWAYPERTQVDWCKYQPLRSFLQSGCQPDMEVSPSKHACVMTVMLGLCLCRAADVLEISKEAKCTFLRWQEVLWLQSLTLGYVYFCPQNTSPVFFFFQKMTLFFFFFCTDSSFTKGQNKSLSTLGNLWGSIQKQKFNLSFFFYALTLFILTQSDFQNCLCITALSALLWGNE